MLEIHLYGKLRRYAKSAHSGSDAVVYLGRHPGETVDSLLARLAVPVEQINHVFVNGKLLVSRTAMAHAFGYVQVRPDAADWDLRVDLADGDRIGLFGTDLAILGM